MCNYLLTYYPCCQRIDPPLSIPLPKEPCPLYLARKSNYEKTHTCLAAREFNDRNSLRPPSHTTSTTPSIPAIAASSIKSVSPPQTSHSRPHTRTSSHYGRIATSHQDTTTKAPPPDNPTVTDPAIPQAVKERNWLLHIPPVSSLRRPPPPDPCPKTPGNVLALLAPAHRKLPCPLCHCIDPAVGREVD
ncbi:Hypothetical protein D9617_34g040730 [Elsinoe fawcettii]|nr:Hypothetical protein D9617_34g040730 [Elsinoe fawcettii]